MPKRYTFVLCDGSVNNSYGFRTNVDGINLDRFKTNPVMLYGHDSWNLDSVIGRWENIRVEGGKLMADAVFDVDTEKGKDVAGRVERGFLRGCSMGLRITKFVEYEDEDVAEMSELVEASICAIPSDSNAVRLYDDNNKVITLEEMKLSFNNPNNNQEPMKKEPEQSENTDSRIVTLEAQVQQRDTEIAQLKATISEMKKESVESFLSAAVKDGKITEGEKEGFAKLASTDFETVKSIIGSKPMNASASLKSMELKHSVAANEDGRENWTYLEWMKKDPTGLKSIKENDPERFAQLQKTI